MARTVIQPQLLRSAEYADLTWVLVDLVNGMQVVNTGHSAVLLNRAGGLTGNIVFPGFDCPFGHPTPALTVPLAGTGIRHIGPFDPRIWGDGTGNLLIDFSSIAGSGQVQVAVVETA